MGERLERNRGNVHLNRQSDLGFQVAKQLAVCNSTGLRKMYQGLEIRPLR